MTPPRMRSLATLPELLLDAHRRAVARGRGESLGLYLVRLTDVAGLALAVAVHEATGGPDHIVLRERAERAGVSKPVMVAAVAVEPLARAIEGLAIVEQAERSLLAWALLEVQQRGEVPVLMIMDGTAIATSLAELLLRSRTPELFAWSLPAIGEA